LSPGQSTILAITALLLGIVFSTRLFGADPTTAGMRFLKATKPPFPKSLVREVAATRNMKYNAIVKITIAHGKIVSVVPSGGNEALSKYLAETVQKTWVADPRMTGTFTLPNKFQLQGR
jgi:hypothetical protein